MNARNRLVTVVGVAALLSAVCAAAPSAVASGAHAPAVSVTGLSTRSGPTAGGVLLTIRGTGLKHSTKVLFGSRAVTRFVAVTGGKLTVRTPRHHAGGVDVRVVIDHRGKTTKSQRHAADRYTFYAPPPSVAGSSSTSTSSSVTLRWSVPSRQGRTPLGLTGVEIRRETGTHAPSKPTSGHFVADVGTPATTFTDTRLSPGRRYSYALFAHDGYRHYAPATRLSAYTLTAAEAAHSWSQPAQPFGQRFGGPAAISCLSGSFCQTVDRYGAVFTYNGSSWKNTARLGEGTATSQADVVCESTTWCMASLDDHDIYHFDGARWSSVAVVPAPNTARASGITALACASTAFCVAGTDDGRVFTFRGTSWSRGKLIDPGADGFPQTLLTLSCPTTAFCVSGDDNGNVMTFNGKAWSRPKNLADLNLGINEVSCVSAAFCVATSSVGSAVSRYNGKKWTTLSNLPDSFSPDSVTCRSATFCLGLDNDDDVSSIFDGRSWAKPMALPADSQVVGVVSCWADNLCRALTANGATVHTAGGWSTILAFDRRRGGLSAISCTAGPFCLATDTGGNVKTLRDGRWTNGRAAGARPDELSCTSATFCAAVDSNDVRVYNGSSWTVYAKPFAAADVLAGISCAAKTFCLVIDDSGETWTFDGSKWTQRQSTNLDLGDALLDGVSCTAPSTCVAVASFITDESTSISDTFRATTWGKVTVISPHSVDEVACSSASFCIATGPLGAYTFNGSRWSRPDSLGFYPTNVSCSSRTFCVATGGPFASVFDGRTWASPSQVGTARTRLQDVTCTSGDFCLVSDDVNTYTRS